MPYREQPSVWDVPQAPYQTGAQSRQQTADDRLPQQVHARLLDKSYLLPSAGTSPSSRDDTQSRVVALSDVLNVVLSGELPSGGGIAMPFLGAFILLRGSPCRSHCIACGQGTGVQFTNSALHCARNTRTCCTNWLGVCLGTA